MTFIKRHLVPCAIAAFGLLVAFGLSFMLENYQVGLSPEFIIKQFAKLLCVAFVWITAHVIIKYWFPTIYNFCYTKAGEQESEFMKSWQMYRTNGSYDQRISMAVGVHLGVMIVVALVMAFAF